MSYAVSDTHARTAGLAWRMLSHRRQWAKAKQSIVLKTVVAVKESSETAGMFKMSSFAMKLCVASLSGR